MDYDQNRGIIVATGRIVNETMDTDDAEHQRIIASVLKYVIDSICDRNESAPPLCEYYIDHFDVAPTNYRTAHSTMDDAILPERTCTIQFSDGSDDESERILQSTEQQQAVEDEDDDMEVLVLKKTNSKHIENEYDILPAIKELRIHVDEDIPLERFGKVVNIVDRLVVIEADSGTVLDFDTVVFDAERNAVGQIFDVFGPVAKPMYAILFNSTEEANEWKVGSIMFYAPTTTQFTHTVFTEKLRQEKITDGCWDGEGECPDDMLAFSDDEAEQRYKAKNRSKKGGNEDQNELGCPGNKKAKYSHSRGRSKFGKRGGSRFQNGFQCSHFGESRVAGCTDRGGMILAQQLLPLWPPSINNSSNSYSRYQRCQPSCSRALFRNHPLSEPFRISRQQQQEQPTFGPRSREQMSYRGKGNSIQRFSQLSSSAHDASNISMNSAVGGGGGGQFDGFPNRR